MPIERVQPDTVLELESEPQGSVVIEGARNTLRIGRNVTLNASISMQGEGSTLEIGDGCWINGLFRIVRGEGGTIRIGRGTTINGAGITMHEAGDILIGEDCMLSTQIHMDVSDMHPIFDRATGERINPARSIEIGEHVWLGVGVRLLKGARIGSGTVIAAGSMVSGTLPSNVIAMGIPARVVRENVEWRRDFDETITPVPATALGAAAPEKPQRAAWLAKLRRFRA